MSFRKLWLEKHDGIPEEIMVIISDYTNTVPAAMHGYILVQLPDITVKFNRSTRTQSVTKHFVCFPTVHH